MAQAENDFAPYKAALLLVLMYSSPHIYKTRLKFFLYKKTARQYFFSQNRVFRERTTGVRF